jgi:hypothetical protein
MPTAVASAVIDAYLNARPLFLEATPRSADRLAAPALTDTIVRC